MSTNLSFEQDSPIAIGAIGGSGTRVLARIVEASGVFMGANLNASHDNLEFTTRFKKPEILVSAETEFQSQVDDFTQVMRDGMVRSGASRWGWKEPNTHIVIAQLLRHFPKLRYVHLLRSGLDMAFSQNKNQVRLWGPIFLERKLEEPPKPADALEYFCEVHRRVTALAAFPEFQDRIIFIHFEELCRQPEREIKRLLKFLDLQPPTDGGLEKLSKMISPPATIGQWRKHGRQAFRSEDLNYIQDYLPETLEFST